MPKLSKRKKRRLALRNLAGGDMVLQITSMADVFTILLVFLLKNLATGDSSINIAPEMMLPVAVAGDQLTEALKLEITAKGVTLADKIVSDLDDFRVDRSDMEANGTLRSLNNAFIAAAKNRKPSSTAPQNPEQPQRPEQRLLVLADQKTPYATLKSVLDTAAGNGFDEFKLVVVEER